MGFGGDSDLEWFSDLGHAIAPRATRVWNCRTCALVQADSSLMVTSRNIVLVFLFNLHHYLFRVN